jgi:outer membrane protein
LQAGVDFPIDKNLSFNIDFKKVNLKTDVYVGGVNKGVLKLDPTLIGVGLGYRF